MRRSRTAARRRLAEAEAEAVAVVTVEEEPRERRTLRAAMYMRCHRHMRDVFLPRDFNDGELMAQLMGGTTPTVPPRLNRYEFSYALVKNMRRERLHSVSEESLLGTRDESEGSDAREFAMVWAGRVPASEAPAVLLYRVGRRGRKPVTMTDRDARWAYAVISYAERKSAAGGGQ